MQKGADGCAPWNDVKLYGESKQQSAVELDETDDHSIPKHQGHSEKKIESVMTDT